MSLATRALPDSLRAYTVAQDYDAYTEAEHGVWRAILEGINERLSASAHPAYARGLRAAGMRLDRIPRIEDMDASLAALGWGAVCVDGFIPPRVFQAMQAHHVLPISGAVRRPEHLDYTPAPDIVHEAAGHAPILADPVYAAFLARIGRLGAKTFSLPADREVFEAIRELSIVKECASLPEAVQVVELRLAAAVSAASEASEAAKLARLYWWTVEYGLVGELDDYRLYGAGLLSSLGESERCHRPEVEKLPLDAACVEVPYDITQEQAQLFVTPDFAALDRVLDDVMASTAYGRGGEHGLCVAADSGERARLELVDGSLLEGLVTREGDGYRLDGARLDLSPERVLRAYPVSEL